MRAACLAFSSLRLSDSQRKREWAAGRTNHAGWVRLMIRSSCSLVPREWRNRFERARAARRRGKSAIFVRLASPGISLRVDLRSLPGYTQKLHSGVSGCGQVAKAAQPPTAQRRNHPGKNLSYICRARIYNYCCFVKKKSPFIRLFMIQSLVIITPSL